MSVCAPAAMTVCPVHDTHKTDGARPHHGIPRACGGGPRPGAEDGCGGAAPRAGLRGRPGPRPGLPTLPGSKPPLRRESQHFEENVLASRGNAALRRGARSLISRCTARTCARSRRALPTRGHGQARPCAGTQTWCGRERGACVCICRCTSCNGGTQRV